MDIAQAGIMAGVGTGAGIMLPRAFGASVPMMAQGGAAGFVAGTSAAVVHDLTGDPLTATFAGVAGGTIAGAGAGALLTGGTQGIAPALGKGAVFGATMGLFATVLGFGALANLRGDA